MTHSLCDLMTGLAAADAAGEAVRVSALSLDSRRITPGTLYIALPGSRAHGATFAAQAVASGAVAILTDPEGASLATDLDVPVVVVDDPRAAMAQVAARFHGHPADRLLTFGVTGTNGKTTTTFLLAAGLAAAGRRAGTIGTIGFRLDGASLDSSGRSTVTTPESIDLQALLADLVDAGADSVALEVSSHALALRRVDGIVFDVAGFINLGRDHLDFHRDLDEYFEAKAELFAPGRCRVAVVNVDDPRGAEIASRVSTRSDARLVTVGSGADADYRIEDFTPAPPLGGRVRVTTGEHTRTLTLGLPGSYNAQDAVIALAMLEAAGIQCADDVFAEVAIPGRMQQVRLGEEAPLAVVDFAHTPQAVSSALDALAAFRRDHRVLVVLGCGGDRDAEKRGPMGAAAVSGADVVIVTDDNPRTEDPASIRAAVLAGALAERSRHATTSVTECPDRAAAIASALSQAGPGDVVAVLGKGHEQGQIIADRVVEFDDVNALRDAWRRLAPEGPR